jgi:magnesium-transporting ATPase (P-type)
MSAAHHCCAGACAAFHFDATSSRCDQSDLFNQIVRNKISCAFVVIALRYVTTIIIFMQQRHRSDRRVNNRKSFVLRGGKLVEAKWQTVVVGDIIKMEKDNFVAVLSFAVDWLTIGCF